MADALSAARGFLASLPSGVMGRKILCAVSGGCDSVCLAHMLYSLKDEMGFSVALAHVEHGIRGETSLRDARFVRDFAARLSLPFYIESVDAPAFAKKNGLSVETAARQLRYSALKRMADEYGAYYTATAHHALDQIETVMMHMLRGSGLHGLCGIAPVSGSLIRPLLSLDKDELLDYARLNSLSFMQDETNSDASYRRNEMRLSVVPALLSYEPSFTRMISRLTESLRMDDEALEALAQGELSARMYASERIAFLRLDGLEGSAGAIKRRLLRAFAGNAAGLTLEYDKTEELCAFISGERGRIINLPESNRAYLGNGRLYILRKRDESSFPLEEKFTVSEKKPQSGLYHAFPKALLSKAEARTRREGDFIIPFGMRGKKNVSDLMTDKKLDLPLRDAIFSVYSGAEALWIPSVCASERLRVSGGDDFVYLSPSGDFDKIIK